MVLGEVFRRQKQIQDLADRLLSHHFEDEAKKQEVIAFLCSESGSHDYTVNRKEAGALGLNIEKPNDELYSLIKNIYNDISDELELRSVFNKMELLGSEQERAFRVKRGLIESRLGGSHSFFTEGVLRLQQVEVAQGVMQPIIRERKDFDAWRHSDV